MIMTSRRVSRMMMTMIFRSPVYLVTKGDMEGARKSLQFFRGGASSNVDEELKEMASSVKERSSVGSVSVNTMLTDRQGMYTGN